MEGGKGKAPAPAPARKKGKATADATAGTKKGRKTVVQMSKEQVDHILSYKPTPFPFLSDDLLSSLPGEDIDAIRAELAAATADFNAAQESTLREQERVRQEYIAKGRVEYEFSDDEGVNGTLPPTITRTRSRGRNLAELLRLRSPE